MEMRQRTQSLQAHASMPPVSGAACAAHWRDEERDKDKEKEKDRGGDGGAEGEKSSKYSDEILSCVVQKVIVILQYSIITCG